MKKDQVFWGVMLILTALLLVLNSVGQTLGMVVDIPVTHIILGILCVAWFIYLLVKRHFAFVFIPVGALFLFFEDEIATLCGVGGTDLISNWLVVLCVVLLTAGLQMLLPHRNWKHHIKCNGDNSKTDSVRTSSFAKYIDSTDFTEESVEVNMGNCDVYFDNIDNYPGGGVLTIENNMGRTAVHVPAAWHILTDFDNNLGKVSVASSGNETGKLITVRGENNLGYIEINLV